MTTTAADESTAEPIDASEWMRDGVYIGPRVMIRLWSFVEGTDQFPFAIVVRAQRHLVAASAVEPPTRESERARDEASYLYTTLRAEFARVNGRIVHEYHCGYATAAAVLTDATDPGHDYHRDVPARVLYTVLNTSDVRLQSLESQCDAIVNDAVAVFDHKQSRQQLRFASESAYHAMAAVLYVTDQIATEKLSPQEEESALAAAATKVQTTADQVQILIQRQARFSYFCGVLVGAVAALAVCALVGVLSAIYWNRLLSTSSLVAAMVLGVFGAVTSVFQRISSGQLVLDYTAPRRQRWLLGGLRAFVGALFGAVVYFAIGAGLVAAAGQTQGQVPTASIGFFAVLGFISGFSERFATDMLERAGQLLVPLATGDRK